MPAALVYRQSRPAKENPSMKIAAGAAGGIEDVMDRMRADHTSAEDAGRIAQDTGVNRYKTPVLSHTVPRSSATRHDCLVWENISGERLLSAMI
jgi:hypothetical protein